MAMMAPNASRLFMCIWATLAGHFPQPYSCSAGQYHPQPQLVHASEYTVACGGGGAKMETPEKVTRKSRHMARSARACCDKRTHGPVLTERS